MQFLATPTSPTSPVEQLLSAVRETRHPLGSPSHLTTFVITTLFNALVAATLLPSNIASETQAHDKLAIWFKSYRYVSPNTPSA